VKILQLIDTLNPGGAERMCVNIANTLHNNGFDVQVCTTRSGGSLRNEINNEIVYHTLDKQSLFDIKAFRKFLHIIRNEKIELVHAHSSSLFWAVAARIFNRKLKIVWHDHLGLNVHERSKSSLYRMLSFKIDGIISVNRNLEEWSKKYMHVRKDKIVFINNFPQLSGIKEKEESELFTIVCLANIRPQKDHETLIKAIGLISKRQAVPPLKVILAGQYDEGDYFLHLKRLTKELNLESIIEFAGAVEDVAGLLAKADCGVLSSLSEGLPVSLLEYGMAGLPVVVTDVGQCAEVVGFGKFGKVVPAKKPELFAEELASIMKNRKESHKLGTNFRDYVEQNYGPEGFMKKYTTLLNKLN
jgi:glycosyltransferase involved in cell wall biosynthesis